MKSKLKQIFAATVGFCLAAIIFIESPNKTAQKPAASATSPVTETPTETKEAAPPTQGEELTTPGGPRRVKHDPNGPVDNKQTDEHLRALVHIADKPTQHPGHRTWLAIYHLQAMVELGEEAVPGIAWVLDRDYEIEFNWYKQPVDVFGISHRVLPRNIQKVRHADMLFPDQEKPNLHYGFPLSLRLGLIEALERIGGPHAEEALLARMRKSTKEIELAYSIKGLQVVSPDYHTAEIRERIKSLLSDPNTIFHNSELEIAARRYLVGLNQALDNAAKIAKEHEGPVNEGIPYKDLKDEGKNRLPVVMSSIFDTTRNLELDAPSQLEYKINRGLEYLDLKQDEEDGEKARPALDPSSRHD